MTWTKEQRKEYKKEYYQAHKEQHKAHQKEYYQAHKEEHNAYMKAYYQAHKEQRKEHHKAYYQAHKEYYKAYYQAHKEDYKTYQKAYKKADVNSLGQTKNYIRKKSHNILKQMNLNIPDYEIHHCFGYEYASKFIYISKSLHLKIHQFLRDNNIDAGCDHWMAIRDIVNSTDEFMYIKC